MNITRQLGRLKIVVVVSAVTALAAACSSSGVPGSDSSGGAGSGQATVTIAIPATITSVDPGMATNSRNTLTIMHDLYATLTQFNDSEQLVADLATSWSRDGARAWTFTLRPGAKFQDGEALDANTIAWNFQRLKDNAKLLGGTQIVAAISSVTVDSATKVTFHTGNQSYLNLPRLVAGWGFLPEKWTASHDPNTQADASGPYELVSFVQNQSIVLKANPSYFGAQPDIKNVDYKVFADQSALVAGLLGGSIDVATELDPDELAQIEATGKYNVGGVPGLRINYLAINTWKKPWNNPLVREAATIAIDRALITKTVLDGYTAPSKRQLFAPGYTGYQDNLQPWPYDPAKARKLLEQAGALGTKAQLWVPQIIFAGAPQAAQVIASELDAAGFDITLKELPIAQWEDGSTTDSAPALNYIGEASPSNSSDYILQAFRSSVVDPTTEQRGPQDKELDDLIQDAWTASTVAEQAKYVEEATDRIDSTYRYIDLWPQVQTYAVSKKLDYTQRADDLDPAYYISWAS